MTNKDSYSSTEWAQISAAPMAAGMYLVLASPGLTSILSETKAMMEATMKGERPAGAQDLINSIMADMTERAENREKIEPPSMPEGAEKDPAAAQKALMAQIADASATVAARGSAEEAAGYNQWLYSVAVATAEAAKEGGFMGIGGERVSDKEQAALNQLKTVLSL